MQRFRYSILLLLACMVGMLNGCCGRKELPPPGAVSATKAKSSSTAPADRAAPEKPLEMLDNLGLNYSIDQQAAEAAKIKNLSKNSFFDEQYLKGVELMESGKYSEAINLFSELIKRYPNGEEASIAELCIAEMYFRNKSNSMALQAYQRIVEKYPNTHAAENARAGIEYLQSFDKFAEEHLSPDIEDRKRRGF